jgi:hypothetical protein
VILQMATLGFGDIVRFPFVDPPEPALVRDGFKLLEELRRSTSASASPDLGNVSSPDCRSIRASGGCCWPRPGPAACAR